MQISLPLSRIKSGEKIEITGSKSETNRLLLLQALYPPLKIENISNSDDSNAMIGALKQHSGEINIHHAGTTMRFLTAYFASRNSGEEVILTGSKRMKERPIKILVDALRHLGADISYVENEGCPPLKIKGRQLTKNKVSLPSNVSSQYISALLLIGPTLENGLELTLTGEITSVPYIKMTLALLDEIGVKTVFEDREITIYPQKNISSKKVVVESDWSSASYWYSFIALSDEETTLTLSSYKQNSLQGDRVLAEIYTAFGVETQFLENSVVLTKKTMAIAEHFSYDLKNAPDIAQTIAVTCFGLGVSCDLAGLHTLKIKETDRLEALKTELTKLGAAIVVSDKSLSLKKGKHILPNIAIDTYNDHRMAMAFTPLVLKTPIIINDAEVVTKSYPSFWEDIKKASVIIRK